jgi:ribosomal-protein-alanine N-acetyltransferase
MHPPDPLPLFLRTERLLIRRYTPADLEDLHAFFSTPSVTRHTNLPTGMTIRETGEFLTMILDAYDTEEPIAAFAVERKEDETVIGSCGFAEVEESGDYQIFYAFLPAFRGRGYATEAASQLLEFLFTDTKADRVVAAVAPENPESGRVAERTGMRYAGRSVHEGRTGDIYALTRKEFSAGREGKTT